MIFHGPFVDNTMITGQVIAMERMRNSVIIKLYLKDITLPFFLPPKAKIAIDGSPSSTVELEAWSKLQFKPIIVTLTAQADGWIDIAEFKTDPKEQL